MIVTATDFLDRNQKIPNQIESRDLENWIDQTEKDLLIGLFGYEMYIEFMEAINGSGTLEDKWQELRDGAEYTYNGKTYKWFGLVDLLKPGVFSKYIDPNTYKFTNIGYVTNSTPQQATLIDDPEPFVVQNWNAYAKKAGTVYSCGCLSDSRENTLYGFLKANESDYPDWCYTRPEFKNRHGL